MDKLSALWQGATHQDKLLQAYRNFHLTTQSIFIAIGAGLSSCIVILNNPKQIWAAYGLLLTISLLGLYMLWIFRKLIRARGEDVNYFHQQIIETEKSLPKEEQVLTAFKVYQKFGRKISNPTEHFSGFLLDESVRMKLVEKTSGRARKILDQHLTTCFYMVWICFHLISIISLAKG